METKQCNKCKEFKTLDNFSKDKSSVDGLQKRCTPCKKQYYQDNIERIIEQNKKYQEDNKEWYQIYVRQYRKDNKDKISQYKEDNKEILKKHRRKYNADNKEKISKYYFDNKDKNIERDKQYRKDTKESRREYIQQYNKDNSDKIRKHKKIYRDENKHLFLKYIQNRRARKMGQLGFLPDNYIEILEQYDTYCRYCNLDLKINPYHIDHIIPLSRGGLHDFTNLQLICATCNLKKNNKTHLEFQEIIS